MQLCCSSYTLQITLLNEKNKNNDSSSYPNFRQLHVQASFFGGHLVLMLRHFRRLAKKKME